MREYWCIAVYIDGSIQRKLCFINSYRLHGLKLNEGRPVKVFIPYELKYNISLIIGIHRAMHPKFSKKIYFL